MRLILKCPLEIGISALIAKNNVCGVLLAGGHSRRMNGHDKAFMVLAGVPLLKRILAIVQPQLKALCLSTNHRNEKYCSFGIPIVQDESKDHVGPLGGIIAGMEWVRKFHPETEWIASFPCDTPFLPSDFVTQLYWQVQNKDVDIVYSHSGKRVHYICSLWRVRLHKFLHRAVLEEGVSEVNALISRCKSMGVEWPTEPNDPFFNINNPEDFEMAEKQVLNYDQG